ncbi:MAG: ATP-binding protein [Lysobacteraceae bacterium]
MHSSVQTSSLLRFHYSLLGLSVVLIMGATLYSAATVEQMRRSIDRVTHTLDAQASISGLLAENLNIEAYGLRYLLSGRDDYLHTFVQASFTLDERIEAMYRQLGDNPEQLAQLDALKDEVALRGEQFRGTIGAYRTEGIEAAIVRIRDGKGSEMISRIHARALAMSQAEQRLLHDRQQQLNMVIVQNNTTVLLVNGLALVAGLIAFFAIRRTGRALEARRMAVLHADQAERANREKSAFLASMSHEIRTPMNAVFGFSQLLSRTNVEPRAREYIKAIQTSGQTLLALINDILDLSRIEAGKLRLEPAPTDLRELVDSTLGVFVEALAGKRLLLDAHIGENVPEWLEVDPHRLRQVLINLVSNAVKYTEHGRIDVHIEAEVDTDGRHCRLDIEVADTGIGIAEDKQGELFDPFFRAVSDSDNPGGSGLGLAIVERLVKLMQGEIDFDSELGRGSRFRVRLPQVPISHADDAGEHAGGAETGEQDRLRLPRSRFLIVDDIAWNRDLLAAMLGEDGDHEFAFAGDGVEALAQVMRFEPDIVLLDLRMPVMDGYEVCRRIRERFADRDIRIVAVSASGMLGIESAGAAQFDAYLRKPLVRETLFRTLAGVLGDPGHREAVTATVEQALEEQADQIASAETLQKLRQLVDEELPGVLAALRVREVRAFAESLDALAASAGLRAVQRHAHDLLEAVDAFDAGMMESLLERLPELLRELAPGGARP